MCSGTRAEGLRRRVRGLALIALLCLAACAHAPATKPPAPITAPVAVSLAPGAWQTYADASTTQHFALATAPDGGLQFALPTLPASADYLFTAGAPSLAQAHGLSATLTVTASPDAVIDFAHGAGNTCPGAPTVRLLIETTGPLMSGGLTLPFTRWYSAPVTLAPGQTTLSAALGGGWTDVFGEASDSAVIPQPAAGEAPASTTPAQGFVAALASGPEVGLTLGGGCFAGHGIGVTQGSATFELNSYTVE